MEGGLNRLAFSTSFLGRGRGGREGGGEARKGGGEEGGRSFPSTLHGISYWIINMGRVSLVSVGIYHFWRDFCVVLGVVVFANWVGGGGVVRVYEGVVFAHQFGWGGGVVNLCFCGFIHQLEEEPRPFRNPDDSP